MKDDIASCRCQKGWVRIAFLTDIHFGKLTIGAVPALMESLYALRPDLILLGGDITQRGLHWQFKHAQRFLEQLPAPWLCIMGNHDVPAWNLLARFIWPYRTYQKFITADLQPTFVNDEVAIIGLNSARRWPRQWAWEQGSIDDRQIASVQAFFASKGYGKTKIVMVHHPLADASDRLAKLLVDNHAAAMAGFAEAGADLILTGHRHWANDAMWQNTRVIQGGSASCNRLRGQPNGFWVIEIEKGAIRPQRYDFDGQQFIVYASSTMILHNVYHG